MERTELFFNEVLFSALAHTVHWMV